MPPRAVWPEVPVVTHLHGTELLMLEQIEQYGAADGDGSRIGLPLSWRICRLLGASAACDCPSQHAHPRGHRLITPPARFAFLVSPRIA